MSSFSALGSLKRTLGSGKVGHAGTLDPFATGLLIALSGKLTRAASILSDMDKEYVAVFRFGLETDTLDPEGSVVRRLSVPPIGEIQRSIKNFIGEIRQFPPAYSAVKIGGKRAYAQARKGLDVVMPERTVRIRDFEIQNWEAPDLTVRIRCSKGTYIRSIARDLAEASGSCGYCAELRRITVGPFDVREASPPENIGPDSGLSPSAFLTRAGSEILEVPDEAAKQLRMGFPPEQIAGGLKVQGIRLLCVDSVGNPAALLEEIEGRWRYRIVFG